MAAGRSDRGSDFACLPMLTHDARPVGANHHSRAGRHRTALSDSHSFPPESACECVTRLSCAKFRTTVRLFERARVFPRSASFIFTHFVFVADFIFLRLVHSFFCSRCCVVSDSGRQGRALSGCKLQPGQDGEKALQGPGRGPGIPEKFNSNSSRKGAPPLRSSQTPARLQQPRAGLWRDCPLYDKTTLEQKASGSSSGPRNAGRTAAPQRRTAAQDRSAATATGNARSRAGTSTTSTLTILCVRKWG